MKNKYNYKNMDEFLKKAVYLSEPEIMQYFDTWYNNLLLNYPTARSTEDFSTENRTAFYTIFNGLDIIDNHREEDLNDIKNVYTTRLASDLNGGGQAKLDRIFLTNFIKSLT